MTTPAPQPTRPTPPPAAPASRRSWLVPAAAAAVLVAAGAWLLAPTAADLLTPGPTTTSSTSAPAGPAPALDEPDADQPPDTSTTATSTSAPSSAPPPDQPQQPTPSPTETASTDTGETPPEGEWRPVAEGFAVDFATPGDDWALRLAAWTTPELAQAYAYTDPGRQPSADLAELEVTEEGPTSVRTLATYAGQSDLVVDVLLVLTPDGWRVTSAAPVAKP